MKKLILVLSLTLFVGTVATANYSVTEPVKSEVKKDDDKKKKAKKKKASKKKKGCCSTSSCCKKKD